MGKGVSNLEDDCSETGEGFGGVADDWCNWIGLGGREGGEEIGEDAALEGLGEDGCGVGLEGDGEGVAFANLVFEGADGFIEGVDQEVDGSGAEGGAAGFRGRVDREACSTRDVGGEGEVRAWGLESDGEDETVGPVWTEGGEEGGELEGPGLGIRFEPALLFGWGIGGDAVRIH